VLQEETRVYDRHVIGKKWKRRTGCRDRYRCPDADGGEDAESTDSSRPQTYRAALSGLAEMLPIYCILGR
jgi:hypothetical protein